MATDILSDITAMQDDNRPSNVFVLSDREESDDRAIKVQRDIAGVMGEVNAQRAEMRESQRYYNGHQWSDVDRMKMEQLKRPAINFNEIMPAIDAVSGLERLNRTDARFKSRAFDSSETQDAAGDLATESVSVVLDLCAGDSERSRAIKEMAIGGLGVTEIRTDYDSEIDGQVVIERVPPNEFIWDTNARKENLEDTRWRARKRNLPRSVFKARWPDKVDQVDMSAPYYDERDIGKYELVTPYYSRANENANPLIGRTTRLSNEIPVIQYQWREMVPVYRIYDQQSPDELKDLSEDQWKKLTLRSQLLGSQPPPAVRQLKPVYKQVFVAYGVSLEEPSILPSGFSLLPLTGKWDEEKKIWYGIVRPMIDPQNAINKSVSSGLVHMLSNAKGGVVFKTGVFVDPEHAKNQWAQPDAWIEATDGADLNTGILQREPTNVPPYLAQLFAAAKQQIQSSGISAEIIGSAQGDTPSPAIKSRVQGGLAVLGWFFDNIYRYRRIEARTMLEFIREYWSHGQLITVGGSFNGQAIQLFKSSLPMDYTLELDDSVRHNPNLKAQVWQDLQPVIPALLRFGFGKFLLTALKFSPLPAQLINELQKEAQAQAQNPQQQQKGRGKTEDPMLTQAKVKKLSAEAEKATAEARKLEQEGGFKVAELVTDSLLKTQELHHQTRLDQHRMEQDRIAKTLAGMNPQGVNP